MSQEIEWSSEPNPELTRSRHDIIRCGSGSMPPQLVLNDEVVGADLHWFQGRSTPHLKTDCPFCGPGKQTVWKGHVCGMDEKTKKLAIVEFTAPCVEPLNAYKLAFGSIRGARLRIHRLGGKPNGKLIATVEQGNFGTNELPLPFDLRAALQFMWNARRDLANIRMESPRVVVDGPGNNDELAKQRPDRAAGIEESRSAHDRSRTPRQRREKTNGHHNDLINEIIVGDDDGPSQTMTLKDAGKLLQAAVEGVATFKNRIGGQP